MTIFIGTQSFELQSFDRRVTNKRHNHHMSANCRTKDEFIEIAEKEIERWVKENEVDGWNWYRIGDLFVNQIPDSSVQKELSRFISEERERCAKVVEQTAVEGDYTGMDESGGSFWQSDAGNTIESAAKRIRDGVEPQ